MALLDDYLAQASSAISDAGLPYLTDLPAAPAVPTVTPDALYDAMKSVLDLPPITLDLPAEASELVERINTSLAELDSTHLTTLRDAANDLVATLNDVVGPALNAHKAALDTAATGAPASPLDALHQATAQADADKAAADAQAVIDAAVEKINSLAVLPTFPSAPAPEMTPHVAAGTDGLAQSLRDVVDATTHTTSAMGTPVATPLFSPTVPPLPTAATTYTPGLSPALAAISTAPTSFGGAGSQVSRPTVTPTRAGASSRAGTPARPGSGVTRDQVRQMVEDAKKRLAAEHASSRRSSRTPRASAAGAETHTTSTPPSSTFAKKDTPALTVTKHSPGLSIRGETVPDSARGFTDKSGSLRGVGIAQPAPSTPAAPSPSPSASASSGPARGAGMGMMPMGMMGAANNLARGGAGQGAGGGGGGVDAPQTHNLDEEARRHTAPAVAGGTIAPGTSTDSAETERVAPVRRRPDTTPTPPTTPDAPDAPARRRVGLFGGQ